jgi:hypothetical protein
VDSRVNANPAAERPRVISDEYLHQQQELHKNPNYGVASLMYAPIVRQLLADTGARSISDYGAGKCNLKRKLDELGTTGYEYFPYDPAFPEYGEPRPADLVCCIDVMEHIEPECLDAVLGELRAIVRKFGFLTIHTGPAAKILSDGRNAHLIQRPASWWLPLLCRYFEIVHLQTTQGGFWLLVAPLAQASAPK